MFTRINFLFGFGLLVLLLFYFVFGFLVIPPIASVARDWAGPVAGAAVLISVGLTVQILAMAMSGLAGVATYARGPDALAVASQAALVCGHGALAYAATRWLGGGPPPAASGLAMIAALYAAGVAIGILEWRRRPRST